MAELPEKNSTFWEVELNLTILPAPDLLDPSSASPSILRTLVLILVADNDSLLSYAPPISTSDIVRAPSEARLSGVAPNLMLL